MTRVGLSILRTHILIHHVGYLLRYPILVRIPAPPLPSCVTLDKLLNFSVPSFLCHKNRLVVVICWIVIRLNEFARAIHGMEWAGIGWGEVGWSEVGWDGFDRKINRPEFCLFRFPQFISLLGVRSLKLHDTQPWSSLASQAL